ncbi:MAG: HXXEE domain-containing protein, partial [Bacteroidota bacterium]
SPKRLFPLICMAGIIVVNGVVHILAAIATAHYNPGLLTSILVFIPLYVWFVRFLVRQPGTYKNRIIFGVIWAFLAHVIMVSGLLMANWFNLFPEIVYFIALIIWSILPVALFRKEQ